MNGGLLKPLLSSGNVGGVTSGTDDDPAPSVYFWRL